MLSDPYGSAETPWMSVIAAKLRRLIYGDFFIYRNRMKIHKKDCLGKRQPSLKPVNLAGYRRRTAIWFKNRIHWIVEGCSAGDTIILEDGAHSTKITVLALYDRYLLGKTRYGSPQSVSYASLYSEHGGVSAVNALTNASIRVRPELPGSIRCREKSSGKKPATGHGRPGKSSPGPRKESSGDRTA